MGANTIVVDVMGADTSPATIAAGATQAATELGLDVVLVGDKAAIGDVSTLPVLEAPEVITMDDDPAQAVRRKKGASMVKAAEAVRAGDAAAMVSAGNTGAAMASALLRMGRISGVQRPAIATPLPIPGSSPTLLLDCGANAECTPAWLAQFAQMGAVFSAERFSIAEPRVALLSIGQEDTKGTPLVKEAHALLASDTRLAGAGLDGKAATFIGNVEGHDILTDRLDVVVTDGFTGNVVLKTLEGSVKFLVSHFMGAMTSTPEAGAALPALLPALLPLREQLDPESYGGAMLLGVDGVCIISHGSSSQKAIFNAVRVAGEMVEARLVDRLEAAIAG